AKRLGVLLGAGEDEIHVAGEVALELVDARSLPAQALAVPYRGGLREGLHELRFQVVSVEHQPRFRLQALDLRPGQRGMRVVEMDEVELLRLEEALEHRRKPSVAAIASGATEDEAHPFGEDRVQGTHPVGDVHTPLEQAIERMSIFSGPRPGETSGLESLVASAHHRQ